MILINNPHFRLIKLWTHFKWVIINLLSIITDQLQSNNVLEKYFMYENRFYKLVQDPIEI